MVCSAWLLVVGGQVQGSRLCVQEEGCCTSFNTPLPSVQCLVAGCRIQAQGSRKRDFAHGATSLFLDAQPAALHLTPDNQQPSSAHHGRYKHTYWPKLLMMGIELPETCWAYYKCINDSVASSWFFFFKHKQRWTDKQASIGLLGPAWCKLFSVILLHFLLYMFRM